MRTRTGNPFREAHGQPLRVFEWICPTGTNPGAVPALIEGAVPGLKCFYRGDGEQNAFVQTSRRPDGSLYVSLVVYDTECLDGATCPGGHPGIAIRVGPAITPAQRAAITLATGEHPQHRLMGTPADDQVLAGLGFTPGDGPRRPA